MKLYDFAEMVFRQEAEGKKVARLFIGESEAPTPKEVVDEGVRALRAGRTRYASAQGEPDLREAIAKRHGVAPENIAVTAGSKFAVFSSIKALCKPGDNVCILSPHWPGYVPICEELGVQARLVRSSLEQNWRPDVDALERMMDAKTRLFVLCNPGNPTSTVMDKKSVSEIAEAARERGARVLMDEAYRGLAFKKIGEQLDSNEDGNLIAGSFSKGFSMTGWRVGYLVASEEIVKKTASLVQATFSCVPQFVQDAALAALSTPGIEEKNMRVYQKRAELACKILSGEFEFATPEAGFYIFPRKKGIDSDKLALKLLEKGVGVAPGSAFGYNEFIRISLVQEKETLAQSLETIVETLRRK